MSNVPPDQRPYFLNFFCLQFLVTSLPLLVPLRGSVRLQVHTRFLFFDVGASFCSLHRCSRLSRGDCGPNSLSRHLVTEEVFFIATIIHNGVGSLIHGLYLAMFNIEYSFMSYRFANLSIFLVILRVTRSAVSRIFSVYLRWSCIPFFN